MYIYGQKTKYFRFPQRSVYTKAKIDGLWFTHKLSVESGFSASMLIAEEERSKRTSGSFLCGHDWPAIPAL